jgi:hypothetical protein
MRFDRISASRNEDADRSRCGLRILEITDVARDFAVEEMLGVDPVLRRYLCESDALTDAEALALFQHRMTERYVGQ